LGKGLHPDASLLQGSGRRAGRRADHTYSQFFPSGQNAERIFVSASENLQVVDFIDVNFLTQL
jgi:hypothetical protein